MSSIPRTALSAKEAAESIGISPRKLWELTNRGEIPAIKLGNRTLYPVAALQRWLECQLPKRFQSETEVSQ